VPRCLLLFNFNSLYATRDDCFYHACLPSSSLSRVHVWFLPRDACINRGLCRHALSVCLCVCLSVTIVHSVKTGKHIVRLFLPSGKPIILVFPNQTAGLLAILAKSIAIAIAILGGNSIAILSAILYFKSVLQYFFQYSISSLCTHTTWHWQSLSTVLLQVEATVHSHYHSVVAWKWLLCTAWTYKNIQRISIWDQGPAVKSKISKEAWKVHQLRALSVTQWVYHMIGQYWIWKYGVLYITKYCFQLLQYFSTKRIAISHAILNMQPVLQICNTCCNTKKYCNIYCNNCNKYCNTAILPTLPNGKAIVRRNPSSLKWCNIAIVTSMEDE